MLTAFEAHLVELEATSHLLLGGVDGLAAFGALGVLDWLERHLGLWSSGAVCKQTRHTVTDTGRAPKDPATATNTFSRSGRVCVSRTLVYCFPLAASDQNTPPHHARRHAATGRRASIT